ncbi:maker394, partial [Drosophila busckii]
MYKLCIFVVLLQLWHSASALSLKAQALNQTAPMTSSANCLTNFPIQIGDKYYHVDNGKRVNWFQAAHNCRQLGGNLVNFESSWEMDTFLSIKPFTGTYYWTSANCLSVDRKFISIATGNPMPYIRWGSGEQKNAGGNE